MTNASEVDATRKASTVIRVYCLPWEHEAIVAGSTTVGLSVSTYLRRLGLGYTPKSMVDLDQVEIMLRISADAGRLGGLLKLWLTDDEKMAAFKGRDMRPVILEALAKIRDAQTEIRHVAETVLKARV
jgi:hypothetical protein